MGSTSRQLSRQPASLGPIFHSVNRADAAITRQTRLAQSREIQQGGRFRRDDRPKRRGGSPSSHRVLVVRHGVLHGESLNPLRVG
jgi:hypothetical protein